MANSTPQVLVVGAGPTGLVTAIELRRRHIDCRIIERRSGPSHTSRARDHAPSDRAEFFQFHFD